MVFEKAEFGAPGAKAAVTCAATEYSGLRCAARLTAMEGIPAMAASFAAATVPE